MNPALRSLPLLGRILIALVFVLAGISKIGTTGATAGYMASHGIPLPNVLVYGVILVELGGGLMLMAGLYARWVAAILFVYTLALAVIFHPYWAAAADRAPVQHAFFFNHLAMMGGMLFVVAFGAGSMSLDAWMRRGADDWEGGLAQAGRHPAGRTQ